MKRKYNVLLAYDVRYYANIEIEADNVEDAKRIALRDACEAEFDPAYDTATDTEVVDVVW